MNLKITLFITILFLCSSCWQGKQKENNAAMHTTYTNPILDAGAEPWAILHNGKYYYTQGSENKIVIWETSDITDLRNATQKTVWTPTEKSNSEHLWAPEIHHIDNKWYIYYTADDGNMDNHQIYVIENEAANPFEGEFIMKGRVSTDKDNNWAIHASTFEHNGERYMIWCGWQKRRITNEKQCIYIAKMKNPWTLSTERILISQPEYEWERQWVNPDGTKTTYPIYVNEAPQYFFSKNKEKVLIYYSASGSWTPYYCVGLLTADAKSDLTDPASWKKNPLPVIQQVPEKSIHGPGGISFVPSPDRKEWYLLYHARRVPNDGPGGVDSRSPRLHKIEWDEEGIPILNNLTTEGTPLPLMSGTQ
ncbi:family 43 glycosylhydrolase [Bacteroides sp. 224]|uniref:glycoside hydrolase family 43 protein n=1 Tax=Bacteroides sp. 224 TaxID=2302936 RepID=UPI0013D8801F|nr:glycoside hydrolase family 43 protein [Bacteroides sp. 224]NDV66581.1 glycosyl hydrolase family 43 [Bacteroides sp. 224]